MSRVIFTQYHPDKPYGVNLWLRYYTPFFDDVCLMPLEPGYYSPEGITSNTNRKLPELLKQYDLVAIPDIDEFLVPDPDKWHDLGEYLDHLQKPIACCTGYNVIQMPWEPILDFDARITDQRQYWQRDRQYDKPIITRQLINYVIGHHFCNIRVGADPDLVMFHLRDADVRRTFERRQVIDNKNSRRDLLQRMNEAVMIPDKWRII